MLKSILFFTLLIVGCYSRKISITSNGAYIARCYYKIFDDLGSIQLDTGNIWAAQTRDTTISEFTHTIKVRCENQRFINNWGPIFEFETSEAKSICFKIGGTTYHPNYSYEFC